MHVLEQHDLKQNLRINFEILDLDEEQDPPTQK